MTASSIESSPETQGSLIKGVEHVAIATKDPQRLARWYVEHLNFAPLLNTEPLSTLELPIR